MVSFLGQEYLDFEWFLAQNGTAALLTMKGLRSPCSNTIRYPTLLVQQQTTRLSQNITTVLIAYLYRGGASISGQRAV